MFKKIISFISNCWSAFVGSIFIQKMRLDPNQEYVLLVDQARKEWLWANKMIHQAKEPELIDQAIFWQSAAERKYVHLLKEAAREGIKVDFEIIVYMALAERNKYCWGVGICQRNYGRSF